MAQKIITIVGPTALGKSSAGVLVARQLNGEIISADSRQVYRELTIGSGKITPWEMGGIPHHMLDVVSLNAHYSVNTYVQQARAKIAEIAARGNMPIIVGGSGLYVDATIQDMQFPDVEPNPALREELSKKSTEELFARLSELDPDRAQTIDSKNPHRLIRAIEIATALGSVPEQTHKNAAYLYDAQQFGLTASPEFIRVQIEKRLDERLQNGLIDEVKNILKDGIATDYLESFGLEYKYVTQYVRGALPYDDMREQLITKICQYAKRQMTWFKRNPNITWFDREKLSTEEMAAEIVEKFRAAT